MTFTFLEERVRRAATIEDENDGLLDTAIGIFFKPVAGLHKAYQVHHLVGLLPATTLRTKHETYRAASIRAQGLPTVAHGIAGSFFAAVENLKGGGLPQILDRLELQMWGLIFSGLMTHLLLSRARC